MKKIFIPLLLVAVFPLLFSCSTSRLGAGLSEKDASAAVRQLLLLGVRESFTTDAFSKERILSSVFPQPVSKVLNTVQVLGITSEVDRFTTTLSKAAEQSATASIPVFESGINNMKLTDAMYIVKEGGTAATDYLRSSIGDSLRRSIKPIVQAALDEYKLNQQWDNITKPVKNISGNKLNVDLPNLMAGVVAEAMFQKVAQKEQQIRTQAAFRTTPLLRRAFSREWKQ